MWLAINREKWQKGSADADNAQALTRNLRERGLWVQKIETSAAARNAQPKGKPAVASKAPAAKSCWKKRIGKVKGKDLTMFCRQFATMINAGVSMVRCLAVLEQQAASPNLKRIIREVAYNVEGGETLTRSLSAVPPYLQQPLRRVSACRRSRWGAG